MIVAETCPLQAFDVGKVESILMKICHLRWELICVKQLLMMEKEM